VGENYLTKLRIAEKLQPVWTYAGEAVYPDNSLIVPYPFSHVIMWAAWNENGVEVEWNELHEISRVIFFFFH
jgi:hypothetical protein